MQLKINDKISFVLNEGGFTYCNCLLIDDEVKTIIDTGADTKSLMAIKPDTIDMVLYTHHHYDHTRGHYLFSNSKSLIHELDYDALVNEELFEYYNSIDKWDELVPGVEKAQGILSLNISPDEETPRKASGTFTDSDIFDLGKTKVQVIHTPGHSAGHCSFWFPDEEFLFSGDICLTAAGPWYGEVLADPDDMINSIDKVIALKPKKVTSCHINSIDDDVVARLTEFKNRIYKRDERIYKFLKKSPADLSELAANFLIYRYHPTPFVLFWEKLMLIKHIERLKVQGLVEEGDNAKFVAK